jgi:hypothetical protein
MEDWKGMTGRPGGPPFWPPPPGWSPPPGTSPSRETRLDPPETVKDARVNALKGGLKAAKRGRADKVQARHANIQAAAQAKADQKAELEEAKKTGRKFRFTGRTDIADFAKGRDVYVTGDRIVHKAHSIALAGARVSIEVGGTNSSRHGRDLSAWVYFRGSDGEFNFQIDESFRAFEKRARQYASEINRLAAEAGPAPDTPAAPAVDVIDQIQRLASLKDQGLLTEVEFDIKKAELLERL